MIQTFMATFLKGGVLYIYKDGSNATLQQSLRILNRQLIAKIA